MKKIKTLLLIITIAVTQAHSQELNCNIQINSDKIQGSNKEVFSTLQQSLSDFVNNTRWTTLTFAPQEKIECNMTIIIASAGSENDYTAELLVQSRRPVYNSSYSTPVLNHRDQNFNFTYQEFDRLEFNNNTFTNNLTALIGYYCYLIIGMDMDTYSKFGGTPCFQTCESIVTSAQTQSLSDAEMSGWTSHSLSASNRNRYSLVNNLMDEAFKPFRSMVYTYHRLGLDEMTENTTNARARIAEELPVLKDANKARTNAYIVSTFLDAKSDEITNIFKKGTAEEKKKIYELMMDIDPTRQNIYSEINK